MTKIHVCQVPLSFPRKGHRTSGTYHIDHLNALAGSSKLTIGVLHLNVYTVRFKRTNGLLFKLYAPRLYKKEINRLNPNIKKYIVQKLSLRSISKRNSRQWIDIVVKSFDIYVKKFGIPDVLHAHSGRGAGEAAHEISKKYNIPFIISEHHPNYVSNNFSNEERKRLTKIYASASYICPVSDIMKKTIEDLLPFNNNKILTVHNYIADDFKPSPKTITSSIPKNKLLVVARLDNNKNVMLALKALRLIKNNENIILNIIGDGPNRKNLEQAIVDYNLEDKVKMLGYRDKSIVSDYMNDSDVLIVTSYYETFGLPVVEALFSKCIVISTKCGGPEYLSKIITGIHLIENDNEVELSEKISEVLKNKTYLKNKINIDQIIDYFGKKSVVSKLECLYNKCMYK